MSRKVKEIDWKKVDELLTSGSNGMEIAAHFHMHHQTFYDKFKEEYQTGFADYSAEKKSLGDSLLKYKQFEKAMKGDNTLLIYLGKVRLKQSEIDPTFTLPNDNKIDNEHEEMTEKYKLRQRIAELEALIVKSGIIQDQPKTGSELCGGDSSL